MLNRFGVGSVSSIVDRRCFHHLVSGGSCIVNCDTIPHSQKTGDAGIVLVQCRASVYGPTLIWYCDSLSRSLSTSCCFFSVNMTVSVTRIGPMSILCFFTMSRQRLQ